MELKMHKGSGALEVSDAVFGREFNEALIHQVVTAYMSTGRAGTRAQKTRSEVRGGGGQTLAPERYGPSSRRHHSQPDLA